MQIPGSLDPTAVAALTPIVAGLVALLRKEWPSIDGRAVYFLTLALALGVAFIVAPDLAAGRANVFSGLLLAVSALSVVSGYNYAVDKLGTAVGPKPILVAGDRGPKAPPPSAASSASIEERVTKPDTAARLILSGALGTLFIYACVLFLNACTPDTTKTALDGGCNFVSLADPGGSGQAIADVCDSLVPVLAPIISDEVNKLVKRAGETKADVTLVYAPLNRKGKQVGYVRVDIARGVQVALDAVP